MSGRTEVTKTATADADGLAVVRFDGPGMAFDRLLVDVIGLVVTGTGGIPDATLYRGAPGDGRRLAYNADGATGWFDGGASNDVIDSGETWSIQWTGCDPGDVCTAALSGTVVRR